jgi:hypothetical protein
MAAKRTKAEVEAVLATPSKDFGALLAALRVLPDDVDPGLAASAVCSLFPRNAYSFARSCQNLPTTVVDEVRRRLPSLPQSAAIVFLREAADWQAAVAVLKVLQMSTQRAARLREIASGPMLGALQASVAFGEDPLPDMFSVLAIDGSEASVDALLPHFTRAVSEQSLMIERLASLKRYAKPTRAMNAMFTQLDELLQRRNSASPALDFARSLGFELDTFSVDAYVWSRTLNRRGGSGVPLYQSYLTIDSTSASWFDLTVTCVPGDGSEGEESRFSSTGETEHDGLKLGCCEPTELPGWYTRAAQRLKTTWNWAEVSPRGLRGKKRAHFLKWLSSGEA